MESKKILCTWLTLYYRDTAEYHDIKRLDYITTRNGDTVTAVFDNRPDITIDVTMMDGVSMITEIAKRFDDERRLKE